MDIKEAFLKNRISRTTYMETVVVETFYNDRFIWHECLGSYMLEDILDKHYGEYWEDEHRRVSLRDVDWDKCWCHSVGIEVSDLITVCERLGVPVNINYIKDTWHVYKNDSCAYCEGSSKSFKDALVEFLFDYACYKDNTIHRI